LYYSSDHPYGQELTQAIKEKLPSAEAVCIQGERISFVGIEWEARACASVSAQRIDLQGRTLIPGFNDNHAAYDPGILLVLRHDALRRFCDALETFR
jgi:predicted amidohydrolase YtcJ